LTIAAKLGSDELSALLAPVITARDLQVVQRVDDGGLETHQKCVSQSPHDCDRLAAVRPLA